MELTHSFVDLLQHFAPVFTSPTHVTFMAIVTGWILSHRHRYITEVIFAGGNLGKGHWCRFHRFFSHAAWDLDTLCLHLAKLVVTILAPKAVLSWAVDDTLCRKRGLTLYGAGMHYDPLISSRSKRLVSWGHDWVVLCLIVAKPFWAPTKVFALPVAMRLYRNRQGLTKGKKGRQKASKARRDPNHRTRPDLALELIQLVARWFPDDEILITGDSAYGGKSILSHLPANAHLISHVHSDGVLYEPAPPKQEGTKGPQRKKGKRLPKMKQWAEDANQPWTKLKFNQFGLHAALAVKTIQALYYTAGRDRLLTIVLVRDLEGKRPDQMFYCTKREWNARQILSAYSYRWAIECTFENCKQLLGLEDPANRLPQAVARTAPMALIIYSLVIVWFHQTGHQSVRLPVRPWYPKKLEPSFADMLTTLRRVSYEEKIETPPSKRCPLKTLVAQLVELLSRAG
jgi:DDE superfamily endonuclease